MAVTYRGLVSRRNVDYHWAKTDLLRRAIFSTRAPQRCCSGYADRVGHIRRGFHYYLWLCSSLETMFSLPISEGLDMGECVGFQTSGPDCGAHRGLRTTTERWAGPSAQRVGARGCH